MKQNKKVEYCLCDARKLYRLAIPCPVPAVLTNLLPAIKGLTIGNDFHLFFYCI